MHEITQKQDSRRIFIDTLIELAEKDDRIVLICCDTGFNYLEKFSEKYPKQFFNFGVTEMSSMIIASAMALSGFKVYIYSMINFMLFRPAEAVRNAVVKHNANVKIIGVAGSSSYKFLGFSHNLLHNKEDFNFCDNIGLDWYAPNDNEAVKLSVMQAYASDKPCYIRL